MPLLFSMYSDMTVYMGISFALVLQHMWQATRQCCTKLITLAATARLNALWRLKWNY